MGNEQDVRRKLLGFVGIGEGSDPEGSAKHDDSIYGGPVHGTERDAPRLGTIYLVSCVSKKKKGPLPAKDLYDSPWFKKARQYVERTRSPWYILSAEHGLLASEMVIESYNRTLNDMSVAQRREWADRVWCQMEPIVHAADKVVILAGKKYRLFLEDRIKATGTDVFVPMAELGRGFGPQLHWLTEELTKHG